MSRPVPPHDGLKCPVSATVMWINWIGVACMLAATYTLRQHPDVPALLATVLAAGAFALPLIVLEFVLLRGKRPHEEGINWRRYGTPDLKRLGVKLLGLWTTLAIIALVYSLFPEYSGTLFEPFWAVLEYAIPVVLLGSPAYFYWIDGKMEEPQDGYWHLGALMLGWSDDVDLGKIKQHALGWLVKAFFLPLMFAYFHGNINHLRNVELPPFTLDVNALNIIAWQRIGYDLLILVDVGVIVVGYTLTMRMFDSHIRSAEPTWSGWLPAIICYQPFWGLLGPNYFAYRDDNFAWTSVLSGYPAVQAAFAIIILLLMGVYTWASVSFGLRFSNLTHRGIITNGPYRWSKHPAYLSKNLSWWFEAMPFIAPFVMGFRGQGWHHMWADALRRTLRLLAVNLIYYIRARTEERHLSQDPTYVRYALWMERHGLMAWVQRVFAFTRYAPPRWWLEAEERVRLERERRGSSTPAE